MVEFGTFVVCGGLVCLSILFLFSVCLGLDLVIRVFQICGVCCFDIECLYVGCCLGEVGLCFDDLPVC